MIQDIQVWPAEFHHLFHDIESGWWFFWDSIHQFMVVLWDFSWDLTNKKWWSGWWWLEHDWIIFPYIGNNDPNWRTPSFFRAVGIPPTRSGVQRSFIELAIRGFPNMTCFFITMSGWFFSPIYWWLSHHKSVSFQTPDTQISCVHLTISPSYCGWKKSCSTLDGCNPIIVV